MWSKFVAKTNTNEKKQNITGQLLDLVLYNRALGQGKHIIGLEQVDEQLGIFENLPEEEQVLLLRRTLDQLDRADSRGHYCFSVSWVVG